MSVDFYVLALPGPVRIEDVAAGMGRELDDDGGVGGPVRFPRVERGRKVGPS